MATLTKTDTAQHVEAAVFTFAGTDQMADTTGALTTIATVSKAFDAIQLPRNAIVVGYSVLRLASGGGISALTVSLGDSASATSIANAANVIDGAGGAVAEAPANGTVRLTIASVTGTPAAGDKFAITVEYVVPQRANEVTA